MKALKLLALGIVMLITTSTQAQFSVNVNIGTTPSWGPRGYVNVDFYYLPDIQAYYDIRACEFVYFGSGHWVRSRNLPPQYRNYDLHRGQKIVLNGYHGNRPYDYYKPNYHVNYSEPYNRAVVVNYDGRRYVCDEKYEYKNKKYKHHKEYDKHRKH
jgi:hypothetical protein